MALDFALADRVLAAARQRGYRVATAESCTGGLVAAALTGIAGSSDVFDRGFVTYSNGAKADMLGVDMLLIADKGAVSPEVARAMAVGALQRSKAWMAVSVTGIAGPGGGTAHKPVGLVYFGLAKRVGTPEAHGVQPHVAVREERFGDQNRATIRLKSVETALALLLQSLEAEPTQSAAQNGDQRRS